MRNLPLKLVIATLMFSAGLSSAWLVHYYSSDNEARTREPAPLPVTDVNQISFEGVLLEYSPHFGAACGDLIHQVAKYRVEKILAGRYAGHEIVVDHPACGGDVFQHITVGSRVRVTVQKRFDYHAVTLHPGILDEEHPNEFYIAEGVPLKVANNK